jgi:hypothetical protein
MWSLNKNQACQFLLTIVFASAASCSNVDDNSGNDGKCTPGKNKVCTCGDEDGTKTCNETGDGWSNCSCEDNADIQAGVECSTNGSVVCSTDADGNKTGEVLQCVDDAYETVFTCPDAGECRNTDTKTGICCGAGDSCMRHSIAGGACTDSTGVVCSFDQEIVLVCEKNTWIEGIHCPPSKCTIVTDDQNISRVKCENGGYSPGDWCDFTSGVVCSTDETKILECQDGTTAETFSCPRKMHCALGDEDGKAVLKCVEFTD